VHLCASARSWGARMCRPLATSSLPRTAKAVDVLVNATSIGLEGDVKDFPVPVDTFHSGQVVVDLVYGTGLTTLVEVARKGGAIAIDGREMLVMQAALAYRLWTGLEPPVQVMRDSLERGER
jgi:shikimate dehydrogenase